MYRWPAENRTSKIKFADRKQLTIEGEVKVRYITLIFILSGCAITSPLTRTPVGLMVSNQTNATDDDIDNVFLLTLNQFANTTGNNFELLNAAPEIVLYLWQERVVLRADKIFSGIHEIACNQTVDTFPRDSFSLPWTPREMLYCHLAHVLVHWMALKYGDEYRSENHMYPYFGPGSISEIVCRKLVRGR